VSDLLVRTVPVMGTVVTIQVVGHDANPAERDERDAAVARAGEWFTQVQACCTRFDAASELRRLCARVGERVAVSEMLFEPLRFALAVAAETDGAFDPTVGGRMESRGYDREHRTGAAARSTGATAGIESASWRDVLLDPASRTVTIGRPLTLDLGAVAKGLAIDLAVRELQPFEHFAVDAGGDLYLGGRNADGEPWGVGIRHPRAGHGVIETIRVSDGAVCTSGDYERPGVANDGGHHIIDGRSGSSATSLASATVVAPTAMVADALATAAFVLGARRGIAFLEKNGVEGLLFSPSLERFATGGIDAHSLTPHGAESRRA